MTTGPYSNFQLNTTSTSTSTSRNKAKDYSDVDNGLGHLIHDKDISKEDLKKIMIQKRNDRIKDIEKMRKY